MNKSRQWDSGANQRWESTDGRYIIEVIDSPVRDGLPDPYLIYVKQDNGKLHIIGRTVDDGSKTDPVTRAKAFVARHRKTGFEAEVAI